MKREDVKAPIPNITDEAMTWILDTTGAELTREKNKAADLQKQLDAANSQLSGVQEKLKAFDGIDVNKLKGESDKLRQQIADMKDGWAFDSALDGAIPHTIVPDRREAIRFALAMARPGDLVALDRRGWDRNGTYRVAQSRVGLGEQGNWSRLELARPDFVI